MDQDAVAAEHFATDGDCYSFSDQTYVAAEEFGVECSGEETEHRKNDVHRDCTIQNHARAERAKLERTCKRQQKRIAQLTEQLASQSKRCKAKPNRTSDCMMIAISRNRSHGSAKSAGQWGALLHHARTQALGQPECRGMHRDTVARWEAAVGDSILASQRSWFEECESSFFSYWSSAEWTHLCLNIVVVACDATRGKAWKEEKLQASCIHSAYFTPDYDANGAAKTCWPDLAVVWDGTARGCQRIVHRQMRLIGCASFDEDVFSVVGVCQLRCINICGDCGPDQNYRFNIAATYRNTVYVWVTGLPCFSHQQSLCHCRALACMDKVLAFWSCDFPYYAVLVKLVHLWRSDPAIILRAAVLVYGPNSRQAKLAGRKVHQCIAGRWGSVSDVESYYNYPDGFKPHEARKILQVAFFGDFGYPWDNESDYSDDEDDEDPDDLPDLIGLPSEPLKQADGFGDDVPGEGEKSAKKNVPHDEIRMDQVGTLKEKRSRWNRELCKAAQTAEWWLALRISHKCKGPLDHFLNVLQKKWQTTWSDGLFRELVWGKASQIGNEFKLVLEDDRFWSKEERRLKFIFPDQLYCAGVGITCVAASEFDARILAITSGWPALLCILVKRPHDCYCEQRRDTSRALLAAAWDHLDATSAKFRFRFAAELAAAATTGKLVVYVFKIVNEWSYRIALTVQPVEGGNSIITKMTETAPRMENVLLRARYTTKQEMEIRDREGQIEFAKQNGGKSRPESSPATIMDMTRSCAAHYRSTHYMAITSHPHRHVLESGCLRPEPLALPTVVSEAARTRRGSAAISDVAAAEPAIPMLLSDGADVAPAAPAMGVPSPAVSPAVAAIPLCDGVVDGGPEDPADLGDAAGDSPPMPPEPWLKTKYLLLGQVLPSRLNASDISNSSRASLRWSYAWESPSLPTACFWISDNELVCVPSAGSTMWLCVSKVRNLGRWIALTFDGVSEVTLVLLFVFSRSTVEVAMAWKSMRGDPPETSRAVCYGCLTWLSTKRATLGEVKLLSRIFRNEKPPRPPRPSKPGRKRTRRKPKPPRGPGGSPPGAGAAGPCAAGPGGPGLAADVLADGSASSDAGEDSDDADLADEAAAAALVEDDMEYMHGGLAEDLEAELSEIIDAHIEPPSEAADSPEHSSVPDCILSFMGDDRRVERENLWRDAFRATGESLQHRHDAWEWAKRMSAFFSTPGELWYTKKASMNLVLLESSDGLLEEVLFSWTSLPPAGGPCDVVLDLGSGLLTSGCGWKLREDAMHRLVYPAGVSDPKMSLHHRRVVHPDTGITLHKGGPACRPHRPMLLQHLQRVWSISCTDPPSVISSQCCYCEVACTASDPLATCASCLLTYHHKCTNSLSVVFSTPAVFDSNVLVGTPLHAGNLCALCLKGFGC